MLIFVTRSEALRSISWRPAGEARRLGLELPRDMVVHPM
jgi:hypothetical protein